MSSVLDEPRTEASTSASGRLRSTMAAARLSFNWLPSDFDSLDLRFCYLKKKTTEVAFSVSANHLSMSGKK
ncbi:MAG: hypothetical protein CME32_19500 [Gimesia sp.]|nr:hypothetical protein [Gimesia sp.]